MSKVKKYTIIAALGLAAGAVFYLPYIKYILYDAQLASMGISNTQSGYLMTIYTIFNMILYVPGGILADKISARKALSYSCIATGALGFVYLFTMKNLIISLCVWAGFAVSAGFVLWAALYRTVRMVGNEDEQGFLYGVYYACNGLACAIVNMTGVWIYGTGDTMESGFFRATLFGAIVPVAVGILLMFLLRGVEEAVQIEDDEPKFSMGDVKELAKSRVVWYIAIVMLIGYGFYSSTSYFTPYLTDVVGVSVTDSGFLSAVRTYLLLLLTPIGGWIADRVFHSTSRWLTVAFIILAVLFGAVLFLPSDISATFASIYSLIPSAIVMMTYGLIASLIPEVKIKKALTGTAVGIVSIVGYLPDAFYSVMFGSWLDQYGQAGYNYIFGFLAASGIVAALLCVAMYRHIKKAQAQ